MDKRGNLWVEIKTFNKATKEVLILLLLLKVIMIIIIIIMNLQNKLYTIQFISPSNDQFAASL